jgi:hypothetical protein
MGYAYTRARARTFVDITCRGVWWMGMFMRMPGNRIRARK